jgi:DHA1 family tetracycline resistance protein-like MFS transporter
MQKLKDNRLLVVIMTIFIDMLGIGILIPVIPLLLTDPRAPFFLLPSNMTVQQGFIMLGFLTASFPLAQFFATPILGQLSDRYGRHFEIFASAIEADH